MKKREEAMRKRENIEYKRMQQKAHFWLLVILVKSWTAAAGCADGWEPYFSTEKCIKGFRGETTWMDAYYGCRNYTDGTLVSIHSSLQNIAVATLAEETFSACYYWIGLSSFFLGYNYTWDDGSPFDFANWVPGDPPSDPAGTAVYFSLEANNRWKATGDIAKTNCYICAQPVSSAPKTCNTGDGWVSSIADNNTCIKGFKNETDWLSALTFCQGQGKDGSLVSIHNTFQNAQIALIVEQTFSACEYWLGLNGIMDSTAWEWTDGSPYNYKNWDAGYPPADPEEEVAYFSLSAHNRWRATSEGAEKRCYLCQIKLA